MENLAQLLADGRAEIVKTDYSSSPDMSEEDDKFCSDSDSELSYSYHSEEENYVDNPLAYHDQEQYELCSDTEEEKITYNPLFKEQKIIPCFKLDTAYILVECLYEEGIVAEIDTRVFDKENEMRDYCLAMIEYYNTFHTIPYNKTDDLDKLIDKLIAFAYEKDDCERKFHNVKIIKCIIKGDNIKIYQNLSNLSKI